MAIYQQVRRRRRTPIGPGLLYFGAVAFAVGVWWTFLRGGEVPEAVEQVAMAPPTLTTDRPEIPPANQPRPDVTEKGDTPAPATTMTAVPNDQRTGSLLANGKKALAKGDLLAARTYFSEAMQAGVSGAQAQLIRAELTRIGNETIFSPRTLEGDPLVGRYIIQTGDSLGKIAKANKISDDLLAAINGIRDKNRIRAGQTIKVITGPFTAAVHKKSYTLDVFLGGTLVKHFKVGLGLDGSTPIGEWQIATKLKNPTYYPPRGGTIVGADDPKNPLGERWIGLRGISGEAMGQLRYGIHGTIEPDSIGRNMSMGCIRMYNEDVEALYDYLVEKHSHVSVTD